MKHLDIGTIHAFLDGELSGAALEEATAHFALCETCSNAMLAVESEVAAVIRAFAAENALAVPTQRIWARINNEIDALDAVSVTKAETARSADWFDWSKFARFLTPPAAFASGLALVVLFSIFSFNRQSIPENNRVKVAQNAVPVSTPNTVVNIQTPKTNDVSEPQQIRVRQTETNKAVGYQVVKANFLRVARPKTENRKLAVDLNAPLAEERLYLDTLNDLSQTVASSNENVMRPSFRVEYEQNIAFMDKAINKMQKQARSNPNDENAKRILFASYQNKIDLLNAVAEKSQLMATLR